MSEEAKKESKFVEMDTKTTNNMIITVDGEDGRLYRFSMPFHSPLPECYNAAINVANEIAKIFNEAVKKQADIESADKKEEVVKESVVKEEVKECDAPEACAAAEEVKEEVN